MIKKYNPHGGDQFIGFFFKTKLRGLSVYVLWTIIFKIIDMNTFQVFGKNLTLERDEPLLVFLFASFCIGLLFLIIIGFFAKIIKG